MARIEIHETTGDEADAACRWTLHLPKLEASVVDALPDKLEQLLGNPDENRGVIDRLFPPSYSDPDEDRENRRLLGSSLLSERREMLKAVRKSMRAGRRRARVAGEASRGVALRLDVDSLDLWLRFVNDMRLMLATELGVDENLGSKEIEPGDPDAPRFTLLIYLGGLESLLVEAAIGDPGF
jgi:hypothetical protein